MGCRCRPGRLPFYRPEEYGGWWRSRWWSRQEYSRFTQGAVASAADDPVKLRAQFPDDTGGISGLLGGVGGDQPALFGEGVQDGGQVACRASLAGGGIIEKQKVIHRIHTSKKEIKREKSPKKFSSIENIIDGGRKKARRKCKIFMKYIYSGRKSGIGRKGLHGRGKMIKMWAEKETELDVWSRREGRLC